MTLTSNQRKLARSPAVFANASEIEWMPVDRIEGRLETGEISIKPLLVGDNMLMVIVFRRKGMIDSRHSHQDHESMCTMISGRARVVIGDEEFVAEPGRPGSIRLGSNTTVKHSMIAYRLRSRRHPVVP